MIKALVKFFWSACFLAAAIWLGAVVITARSLDPALLPDKDFLPEIEKLVAEKRFQEAEKLCCDVIGMKLPNADKANEYLRQCTEARRSWFNNARDAVKGFVTGEGRNSASIAGAVASDLFVYGDLRDLGIQGYRKLRGLPVDVVLTTVAGIGVLAELSGLTGTAPALLKNLYRMGGISLGLLDAIRSSLARFRINRKLSAADKELFANLGKVSVFHGVRRSKTVLCGINSPGELAAAVKLQSAAPEVPWLIAHAAPLDSGKIFLRYSEGTETLRLLKTAARKGEEGAHLLRKIRIVKWSVKNFWQGRFQDMLLFKAIADPAFRRILTVAAFVCMAISCGLFAFGALSAARAWRSWKQVLSVSAAES